MNPNVVGAEARGTQESSTNQNITDVYISVYFDGTGNNMYEQLNKGERLKKLKAKAIEEHPTTAIFAASNILFSSCDPDQNNPFYRKAQKNIYDHEKYGMTTYYEQKEQAEEDPNISNYGGLKYSNVAILRSLTKTRKDVNNNSLNYNLYIEGSGKHWDTGMDMVGLGMGTGRTGVVGLVSKAIVFITEFLNSHLEKKQQQQVNLHFAVYGFSRGSTCGRVFSYLVTGDPNMLKRKEEFKQYLPKKYFEQGRFHFLDNFTKKTVDFLGIYDTVSSIGFLLKDDNSADYGINRFVPYQENGETKYVNWMHGSKKTVIDSIKSPVPIISVTSALGRKMFFGDAMHNFHRNNATEYGLYSHHNEKVKHTFHICAMDEFRENFALVDLGTDLKRCAEVFMPGCHSDIGGGFMKEDDIERYTLRRTISHKAAKMNESCDPRIIKPTERISKKVMGELGWLRHPTPQLSQAPSWELKPEKSFGRVFMESLSSAMEPEAIQYTRAMENERKRKKEREDIIKTGNEGMSTYIDEMDDKIEFERFAMEGYSNITLQMMLDRAVGNYGLNDSGWPAEYMPSKEIPTRFQLNNKLKEIRNKLKANADSIQEKERTWLIPDRKAYEDLRQNYLHFSCTDELNIEKGHLSASGANLGNPPCWRNMNDEYFLLSRIVYKGDDGEKGIHYMDEYRK